MHVHQAEEADLPGGDSQNYLMSNSALERRIPASGSAQAPHNTLGTGHGGGVHRRPTEQVVWGLAGPEVTQAVSLGHRLRKEGPPAKAERPSCPSSRLVGPISLGVLGLIHILTLNFKFNYTWCSKSSPTYPLSHSERHVVPYIRRSSGFTCGVGR